MLGDEALEAWDVEGLLEGEVEVLLDVTGLLDCEVEALLAVEAPPFVLPA